MPRIKYLESIRGGVSVWIYYKDHGFPHVEIYKGKPSFYEAHLKLNLLDFSVMECSGFSERAVRVLLKELEPYRSILLRDWYEITES